GDLAELRGGIFPFRPGTATPAPGVQPELPVRAPAEGSRTNQTRSLPAVLPGVNPAVSCEYATAGDRAPPLCPPCRPPATSAPFHGPPGASPAYFFGSFASISTTTRNFWPA